MLIPDALILGIDTSTRQGSVALLRASLHPAAPPLTLQPATIPITIEVAPLTGQPSETLIPAIAALLQRHGLDKRSLSLIGVATGPGSFTGLRVAIATVKGLAEAFAIPVVPVSVLEAIALTSAAGRVEKGSPAGARVFTAIDAQRNQIFFGEFALDSTTGLAVTLREDLAPFAAFASSPALSPAPAGGSEALSPAPAAPVLLTPDAALAVRLREAGLQPELVACPSAEDIARIAHRKYLAGLRSDVATLDANYLRRSDAEIFSAPKPGIPRP